MYITNDVIIIRYIKKCIIFHVLLYFTYYPAKRANTSIGPVRRAEVSIRCILDVLVSLFLFDDVK